MDSGGDPPRHVRVGWRDTLLIVRAARPYALKAVVFVATFFGVIATTIVFFTYHPALALIPVALTAVALYFFARWEQKRFRPPGL